jgi:hypothetical protein
MRVVVAMPEFNPQEIKAISENRQSLYVDGEIKYDDGFGSTDRTPFAFKYIPPGSWEAVAHLEERLINEEARLALNNRITIDPPSFERSRKLSPPTYIPSPIYNTAPPSVETSSPPGSSPAPSGNIPSPSATSNIGTPVLMRQRSVNAHCGCTCRIACGNMCEYECVGCSLIEGAETAKRCCDAARQSVGEMDPCPGQN